ncbi:hypothetical protein GALMADRAFT_217492 [Galerina marginata CBS 339.88]|uniref:Uncharacterized protein n=1 Tax=Galerina marginata (strain CBS 339.88) TaxID=685588 RepID=A0A067S6Q8_GALM3|nr:hypothetical protein GALMADRAFT_217492 [Galerina marginata CBS 339.88]
MDRDIINLPQCDTAALPESLLDLLEGLDLKTDIGRQLLHLGYISGEDPDIPGQGNAGEASQNGALTSPMGRVVKGKRRQINPGVEGDSHRRPSNDNLNGQPAGQFGTSPRRMAGISGLNVSSTSKAIHEGRRQMSPSAEDNRLGPSSNVSPSTVQFGTSTRHIATASRRTANLPPTSKVERIDKGKQRQMTPGAEDDSHGQSSDIYSSAAVQFGTSPRRTATVSSHDMLTTSKGEHADKGQQRRMSPSNGPSSSRRRPGQMQTPTSLKPLELHNSNYTGSATPLSSLSRPNSSDVQAAWPSRLGAPLSRNTASRSGRPLSAATSSHITTPPPISSPRAVSAASISQPVGHSDHTDPASESQSAKLGHRPQAPGAGSGYEANSPSASQRVASSFGRRRKTQPITITAGPSTHAFAIGSSASVSSSRRKGKVSTIDQDLDGPTNQNLYTPRIIPGLKLFSAGEAIPRFPSDEEAGERLIATMDGRKLTNINEKIYWTMSDGYEPLVVPSFSLATDDQDKVKPGHVHFHRNRQTDQFQIWQLESGNEWTRIEHRWARNVDEPVRHPNRPDLVLDRYGENSWAPNYITMSTYNKRHFTWDGINDYPGLRLT